MKQGLMLLVLLAVASASLFSVEHTKTLYAGEDNNYTLRVASGGSPVPNATISLYRNDSLLGEQNTDADGLAVFTLRPDSEGLVAFRIVADGYNEYIVFQDVVARPAPEPTATPVPAATPLPAATPEPTAPAAITGFVTLNPGESGVFLFMLALVFTCLIGSSYIYAKNLIGEEMGGGSWEDTKVLDGVARWLKGEEQHNNY